MFVTSLRPVGREEVVLALLPQAPGNEGAYDALRPSSVAVHVDVQCILGNSQKGAIGEVDEGVGRLEGWLAHVWSSCFVSLRFALEIVKAKKLVVEVGDEEEIEKGAPSPLTLKSLQVLWSRLEGDRKKETQSTDLANHLVKTLAPR